MPLIDMGRTDKARRHAGNQCYFYQKLDAAILISSKLI